MSTYLGIDHIEETGPLVRIDHHNLPDLDMLLLDVYAWQVAEGSFEAWEEPWSFPAQDGNPPLPAVSGGGDRPTRIDGAYGREVEVAWFRKNPCACGDEHTFDTDSLGYDENSEFGRPDVRRARGAFMGVYFG